MFTAVNSISAKGVNTFLDLFQNWHHFSSGAVIRFIHHCASSAKALTGRLRRKRLTALVIRGRRIFENVNRVHQLSVTLDRHRALA